MSCVISESHAALTYVESVTEMDEIPFSLDLHSMHTGHAQVVLDGTWACAFQHLLFSQRWSTPRCSVSVFVQNVAFSSHCVASWGHLVPPQRFPRGKQSRRQGHVRPGDEVRNSGTRVRKGRMSVPEPRPHHSELGTCTPLSGLKRSAVRRDVVVQLCRTVLAERVKCESKLQVFGGGVHILWAGVSFPGASANIRY